MKNQKWNQQNIPDLTGKIAIVTGANSGIGLQVARDLSAKNCHVVMAARNMDKVSQAIKLIRTDVPQAILTPIQLNLASIESVKLFSKAFHSRFDRLDILCNNAGVMNLPEMKTEDGFEMQFGTNHLGHFALTGLLFDVIKSTGGARIVSTSSIAHKFGRMHFNDIGLNEAYGGWKAYGQSKLANLLFFYELQRRINNAGVDIISVASHPGWTSTNLQNVRYEMEGSMIKKQFSSILNRLLAQNMEAGALPTLYAATAEGVKGGEYFGPSGLFELSGYPKKVESNSFSQNVDDAATLWELSEEMIGVHYDFKSVPERVAIRSENMA